MALPDPVRIADPLDRVLHTADLRPTHQKLLPNIDRTSQHLFPRHRVRRLCACFLVCLHLFHLFHSNVFLEIMFPFPDFYYTGREFLLQVASACSIRALSAFVCSGDVTAPTIGCPTMFPF